MQPVIYFYVTSIFSAHVFVLASHKKIIIIITELDPLNKLQLTFLDFVVYRFFLELLIGLLFNVSSIPHTLQF